MASSNRFEVRQSPRKANGDWCAVLGGSPEDFGIEVWTFIRDTWMDLDDVPSDAVDYEIAPSTDDTGVLLTCAMLNAQQARIDELVRLAGGVSATPSKGEKGGKCNVTRCPNSEEGYWNKSTKALYCKACADAINWPGGRANTMAMYCVPLLCEPVDEGSDDARERGRG